MKPKERDILWLKAALDQDLAKTDPNERRFFNAKDLIPNRIKGYVASFGATVIQLGIMPACVAYEVDKNKKALMLELIQGCYTAHYAAVQPWPIHLDPLDKTWLNLPVLQKRVFRERVTSIAVALKMALRCFEFDMDDND